MGLEEEIPFSLSNSLFTCSCFCPAQLESGHITKSLFIVIDTVLVAVQSLPWRELDISVRITIAT